MNKASRGDGIPVELFNPGRGQRAREEPGQEREGERVDEER